MAESDITAIISSTPDNDTTWGDHMRGAITTLGATRAAVLYPHLKSSGTYSTAIQADFDAGIIPIGTTIQTAAYHSDTDDGGCVYRVVASATGTADGGAFHTFTGFQLKAVFGDVINVYQYGAKGDGVTDDAAAIQAAVDYAIDPTLALAPASNTRYAKYRVEFGHGDFLINSGILIRSCTGLVLHGAMPINTRIIPNAAMDYAFWFDGIAQCDVGKFRIEYGGYAGPLCKWPMRYDWTTAAARSSTGNVFRQIAIRGVKFQDGFAIARHADSDGRQVDESYYIDVKIDGGWDFTSGIVGVATDWVNGFHIAGSTSGNCIGHFFDGCNASTVETAWRTNGVSDVHIKNYSGGRYNLLLYAGGFNLSLSQGRAENIGRVIETGSGSAFRSVSVTDFHVANGDTALIDITDSIAILWTCGGALTLKNVQLGPQTLDGQVVRCYVNTGSPVSVSLNGVHGGPSSAGPGVQSEACFVSISTAGNPVTVSVDGYTTSVASSGSTVNVSGPNGPTVAQLEAAAQCVMKVDGSAFTDAGRSITATLTGSPTIVAANDSYNDSGATTRRVAFRTVYLSGTNQSIGIANASIPLSGAVAGTGGTGILIFRKYAGNDVSAKALLGWRSADTTSTAGFEFRNIHTDGLYDYAYYGDGSTNNQLNNLLQCTFGQYDALVWRLDDRDLSAWTPAKGWTGKARLTGTMTPTSDLRIGSSGHSATANCDEMEVVGYWQWAKPLPDSDIATIVGAYLLPAYLTATVGTAPAALYTPTNDTTDRSFDADTVAVAELADIVATLIKDLGMA